jgi:hypothetical protein
MPVKGSRKPRICKKCGERDPNNFYPPHASECKTCICKRTRDYQRGNNPFHRRHHLKRSYGITPERYEEELVKQNGLCALCGKPPVDDDLQTTLVVDHDHKTKKFRALVHGRCNSVIGYAQENTDILQAAAAYLRRHS